MALALLGRQPPTLPENGHSKNGDSENGHKAEENGKTETENGDADKETTKRKAEQDKPEFIATEGESKHESHDEKYDKDREAATDRVHEALEQVYNDPALKPGTSGIKRKAEDDKKKEPVPAKKGLTMDGWVGDFNESDLDSSSDEEDSDESKGSQG